MWALDAARADRGVTTHDHARTAHRAANRVSPSTKRTSPVSLKQSTHPSQTHADPGEATPAIAVKLGLT